MRSAVERILSLIFGAIFIALSLVVTTETILRKVFNVSMQGADELGGYALAVGATIAFSVAMFGRNHIRVDVFHERFPRPMQAALNWLSVALMAMFATLIAWLAFKVIQDTMDYRSVAQTPWATPLIYPQSVWFAGLAAFALVTIGFALRATWLLLSRRIDELNVEFHPKSAKEELSDELESVRSRRSRASDAASVDGDRI